SAPSSVVKVDPPYWRCGVTRLRHRLSRACRRPSDAQYFSGYFTPIGHDGERKGDDEDAAAPGEGDPDIVSNRLLRQQCSDSVDNRGDWLVSREGTHGPRHRGRGHER